MADPDTHEAACHPPSLRHKVRCGGGNPGFKWPMPQMLQCRASPLFAHVLRLRGPPNAMISLTENWRAGACIFSPNTGSQGRQTNVPHSTFFTLVITPLHGSVCDATHDRGEGPQVRCARPRTVQEPPGGGAALASGSVPFDWAEHIRYFCHICKVHNTLLTCYEALRFASLERRNSY